MVLWKDIKDFSQPLRFQIPKVYSESDISEFGTVYVQFQNQEFIEWFKNMEKTMCCEFPTFDSKIDQGDGFHIKCVQGFTQYFDSRYNLIFEDNPPSLRNKELECIIDVSKYGPFNGKYGVSIKLYQVRLIPQPQPECLL
jgi:hypothetical protein